MDSQLIAYHTLEHFPTSIAWFDEQGQLLAANQAFSKTFGYTSAEQAQLSIHDIDPYASKISWKKTWESLKEKPAEAQVEYIDKMGKLLQVHVRSLLLELKAQSLVCQIIATDTASGQHKTLHDIISKVKQIAAWEWNLEDNSLIFTPQLHAILELNPDLYPLTLDSLPTFAPLFLKPPQIQLVQQKLSAAKTDGKAFNLDMLIKNGKQKEIWVRFIAQPVIEQDRVVRINGILRNISDLKKQQIDLELYRTTMANAAETMLWINKTGKIIYFNTAALNSLGYNSEELKTKYIWDITTDTPEEQWPEYWEQLKAEEVIHLETIHQRKDGSNYPVELIRNMVKLEDTAYICAVGRNLTNRKEREQELQKALKKIKKLQEKLEADNTYLKAEINQQHNSEDIISNSKKYRKVLQQIYQVAPTDATVLILGETGTGKELLARAIHKVSNRSDRPLVKVNCAALPENLIESELFGHEKGAFTGAYSRKIGRFELADKGTIFLDEIGELQLDLQSKLLRVLQEGEIQRLGGLDTIKVDVRVIAATNRNLAKLVEKGHFREDLYYRLNVFPIDNIPLRERKEDIPLLVRHFVSKYTKKAGKQIDKIPQTAIDELMQYHFPGNIRELENIIERAVVVSTGNVLRISGAIPKKGLKVKDKSFKIFDEMVRDHLIAALKKTNWRVSGNLGAAKLLDMNPKTLESKMRKYNIRRQDFMIG